MLTALRQCCAQIKLIREVQRQQPDLRCCAAGLTDLRVPPPEVTALAITHNAATELTDGLAGFLGGKARFTVRGSLRLECSKLCPLDVKTAELALPQHLQSVVPMKGLGPPSAGQVVVQMAGNRATGGGGAFVFGLRRADSSWSNSSLEATAGGADLQSDRHFSLNQEPWRCLPNPQGACASCSKEERGLVSQLLDLLALGVHETSTRWKRRLPGGNDAHGGRHLP